MPSAPSSLHLPGVEQNLKPGTYRSLIEGAKARGDEYSKIWDLFAFQHDVTLNLGRFTQGVLRTPATITPALRELIAAYTSHLNECRFCTEAHAQAAGELYGDHTLVRQILHDPDGSPLEPKDKALLRFVRQVTLHLPTVTRADVQTLQDAGWDDEAIYFAITTCALFNFYNRWITATGVPEMSADAHRQQGQSLAQRGYVRDWWAVVPRTTTGRPCRCGRLVAVQLRRERRSCGDTRYRQHHRTLSAARADARPPHQKDSHHGSYSRCA